MIRPLVVLGILLALPGCEDSTAPTSPRRMPTPPPAPEPDPGPGPVPPEIAAWVEVNALPFDGAHLSLPHTDIEFLRDLVGDARIVALGENTHGTRDFFEMKARILRFLVEEMGFNTFAIEATWPAARCWWGPTTDWSRRGFRSACTTHGQARSNGSASRTRTTMTSTFSLATGPQFTRS